MLASAAVQRPNRWLPLRQYARYPAPTGHATQSRCVILTNTIQLALQPSASLLIIHKGHYPHLKYSSRRVVYKMTPIQILISSRDKCAVIHSRLGFHRHFRLGRLVRSFSEHRSQGHSIVPWNYCYITSAGPEYSFGFVRRRIKAEAHLTNDFWCKLLHHMKFHTKIKLQSVACFTNMV